MPKVEAPIGDAKVDTSDPTGSAMSVLMAIGGFGLLAMVYNYGDQLGDWLTAQTDQLVGTNASGSNSGEMFGNPE